MFNRIHRHAGLIGLALAAALLAGCGRPAPAPAATAAAGTFHPSDPAVIAQTGRPQLLEFYIPT